MSDGYKTIRGAAQDELEEKKSRFIAQLLPVQTEEEAVEFINSVKAQNRKARHNVYAYILRKDNISRYSDDGEPQGTGGVPVLETLKGAGLTDVCCVVTRYFGGVLLGTGGLARAYSGSCKLAVNAAQIMEICRCSKFDIACDYDLYGKLTRLMPEYGAKTLAEDFAENVKMTVIVKSAFAEAFRDELVDASNGRVDIDEITGLYEDFA
ncbi:MAG: YigZ family protein [Ruminococcus sp.]|nr:YigZ family protein [Ruminococcus sp.]